MCLLVIVVHPGVSSGVLGCLGCPGAVHTNTGKHHIPESTFNYQKALRKICARRCLFSQGLLYCAQLLIKDTHM